MTTPENEIRLLINLIKIYNKENHIPNNVEVKLLVLALNILHVIPELYNELKTLINFKAYKEDVIHGKPERITWINNLIKVQTCIIEVYLKSYMETEINHITYN